MEEKKNELCDHEWEQKEEIDPLYGDNVFKCRKCGREVLKVSVNLKEAQ